MKTRSVCMLWILAIVSGLFVATTIGVGARMISAHAPMSIAFAWALAVLMAGSLLSLAEHRLSAARDLHRDEDT